MNVVTSEIHQDGLCFDMLQDGIFEEDDKNQADSFDQCEFIILQEVPVMSN